MIPQSRFAHPRFAVICGIWLIVSVIVPALPIAEELFLLLVFIPVFWLVGLLWVAIPAGALHLGIKRLLARQYLPGVGWLTIPAAGIALCFWGAFLGDTLRFQWNKASYDRVVADAVSGKCTKEDQKRWHVDIDMIDCGNPVTVIFIWNGFLSMWNGVVYDAGDQIAKEPQERSRAWSAREIGGLLSCSGASRALGGHYYRASGNYTSRTEGC